MHLTSAAIGVFAATVAFHAVAAEPGGPISVGQPLIAIDSDAAALIQRSDRAAAPPILKSPGHFTARTLSRAPLIDGHEWIAADVHLTSSPGRVTLPTRAFALTATDCGDHDGDFVRCQVLLHRGRTAPVRIDDGFTGWVFVTPDARYIVTEPLYVLDVREWKQYALFDALHISNYTKIEALSRDGKRLFISRRDCAMDCRDVRTEYYELILP
jgi:hypothetical protein